MQVDGTRLYRVRDVAERFEVSVAPIYRAIESEQLSALELGTGTGTLQVTGAAVLAYEKTCTLAAYRSWLPGSTASDVEQSCRGELAAEGGAA